MSTGRVRYLGEGQADLLVDGTGREGMRMARTQELPPLAGPSGRRSVGKRLRFEVFKRDFFTCQYCGRQPPDVILEADHIEPKARGGADAADNLVTACADCNRGKAARELGDRIVRPDADLLLLAVQQELVELRRFREAEAALEKELALVVKVIQRKWKRLSALDWCPSEMLLRQMLATYSPDQVAQVAEGVARKIDGGYLSERGSEWVKYMWGALRTRAAESKAREG
jgi:5-methylcytosine-specific restriction endonuclease McrA